MIRLDVGDKVTTKKPHPCGSKAWTVTRTGADVKLTCDGCGHTVMLDREKATKIILTVNGESIAKRASGTSIN